LKHGPDHEWEDTYLRFAEENQHLVPEISEKGLDLIRRFEGLSLQAYRCPAGILTIGYGSTGPHVKAGKVITTAEANDLLLKDVKRFEDGVSAIVGPTTQPRFDALVSFAFNLGLGNLMSSTLLKRHKSGDFQGAADQFLRWNKAKGKVLPGLTKRRAAERALYLS
jgi:lysozyme